MSDREDPSKNADYMAAITDAVSDPSLSIPELRGVIRFIQQLLLGGPPNPPRPADGEDQKPTGFPFG